MNIATAIQQTVTVLKSGEPVLLLGAPGAGKTEAARAVAAAMGLPYREIRAAEFESVDFRGVPTVEGGRTKWNLPDFWPSEPCLINFDEISQASPELTSPLLKIFLGRAIGDYTLPEGCVIMATANRVEDRAGCSRISSALRERCVVLNVHPDAASWLNWYSTYLQANEGVRGFIENNMPLLHKWDAKLDHNQPTPRNWTRLGRLLNSVEDVCEIEEETVAGIIGMDAARTFLAWQRVNVSVPSLVSLFAGAPLPSSPIMMAKVIERLVAHKGDVDRIANLVDSMTRMFQVQWLKAMTKSGRAAELRGHAMFKKIVTANAAAIVASQN